MENFHTDLGPSCGENLSCERIHGNLGFKKMRTTPLQPQSDGVVERHNRTKNKISFIADQQRDWDKIYLRLCSHVEVHNINQHATVNRKRNI